MLHKSDKIKFTVSSRKEKKDFKTFTEAENHAKTLGVYSVIDLKATSACGESSLTASVATVNAQGVSDIVKPFYLELVDDVQKKKAS